MRKLFFFIPSLECGGAEKVLVDLVNNLNKDMYDISITTLLGGGVFEKKLKHHINYRSILIIKNKLIRKMLFYVIAFIIPPMLSYRIIVKKRYDFEISYLEGITTKILAASNNHYAIKIAFVHTDFSCFYNLFKVYKTYKNCYNSYQMFDKVCFVSDKAKVGFEKKIGHLSSSITINNVLDVKPIIELSKETQSEKKNKKFLFISVGRLCYQKGYDRLIEAVFKVNAEKFDFEIWIIGEGNDRQKLNDLMTKHKIFNVKLLGYKDNPYKYISASDMFICSSRVEGFSTVVTEALILGIPVLTTDCTGMREILDNGKYGLIVENNIGGLYSGMKTILKYPEEQKKYSLLAKEYSNYFSMERSITNYDKLFDAE